MSAEKFHPNLLKACVWAGPAFALMWLIGGGPLSFFILPPPSAADSAAQTVANYTDRLTAIRVGCIFMIFSSAIYCVWAVVVTLYTREAEGHRPALFWIQMLSLAACEVVVLMIGFFWGVAAFRAGDVSPDVTQALNDLGWFGVLFTGAPFAAYCGALGVSILIDRSERPYFPRWVGYYNLFVMTWMIEAAGIILFKHGAFSQNGLMVFYVPMIAFFTWIMVMSYMAIRAVNRERDELATRSGNGAVEQAPAEALVSA